MLASQLDKLLSQQKSFKEANCHWIAEVSYVPDFLQS